MATMGLPPSEVPGNSPSEVPGDAPAEAPPATPPESPSAPPPEGEPATPTEVPLDQPQPEFRMTGQSAAPLMQGIAAPAALACLPFRKMPVDAAP
jgi:hypothetical protein